MDTDQHNTNSFKEAGRFPDAGTQTDGIQDGQIATILNHLNGKSIVLVGIMGSGKTSVGRRLATRLGIDFTDADSEIEAAAGMSIPDIFTQHSETYFRNGERRVIERLLREQPRVLATGGGAFMNSETREIIASTGISVWLKADHDMLMRRVRKRSNRPLLQTNNPDKVMQQLMDERYPIYAHADITVASSEGPHDIVVQAIIDALTNYVGVPPHNGNVIAQVKVDLARQPYDILIGHDLIRNAGEHISKIAPGAACAIITDVNVAELHLESLISSLSTCGIRHAEIIIQPGEPSKSIGVFSDTCDAILAKHFERRDVIVALGGGVVGDLAGFAAATIRRGMRFIQLPTTLLAQVNSSVGGKTAINTKFGKNLVGAFYQPSLVLADIGALDTLPEREFRGGYAEIVKYGVINDAQFFSWLEQNWNGIFAKKQTLVEAIRASCQAKAIIVARDETEQGDRALLNLGHTFAHALEVLCKFDPTIINHGEAVAIGLACAARFSVKLGHMQKQDADRISAHIDAVKLPSKIQHLATDIKFTSHNILAAMYQDKKVTAGALTFILMHAIGRSFIAHGIGETLVLDFLNEELKTD